MSIAGKEEVREIYTTRLVDLLFRAQSIHRENFDPGEVQLCQLLSIKTGGCPEDCAYCPQSAHYETGVERQDLLSIDHVLKAAQTARDQGVTVCCGGIIGMGELDEDRIGLLHQLACLEPQPESVPINMLVRIHGTPLGENDLPDPMVFVRTIASARILMPKSRVRLSAGRR